MALLRCLAEPIGGLFPILLNARANSIAPTPIDLCFGKALVRRLAVPIGGLIPILLCPSRP